MWAFFWSSFCFLAWVSRVVLVTKRSRLEYDLGQKFSAMHRRATSLYFLPISCRFSLFRFWAMTAGGDGEFITTLMKVMSSASYLSSHSLVSGCFPPAFCGIVHRSPVFACFIDISVIEGIVIYVDAGTKQSTTWYGRVTSLLHICRRQCILLTRE